MPQLSESALSVGANAVTTNRLAGTLYEFMPVDAFVEFGLVAAAAGLNATVITGTDVLQNDSAISSANRFPVYPDDFTLNDAVAAGERMVLTFRNTTGAAILVTWSVKITPL